MVATHDAHIVITKQLLQKEATLDALVDGGIVENHVEGDFEGTRIPASDHLGQLLQLRHAQNYMMCAGKSSVGDSTSIR